LNVTPTPLPASIVRAERAGIEGARQRQHPRRLGLQAHTDFGPPAQRGVDLIVIAAVAWRRVFEAEHAAAARDGHDGDGGNTTGHHGRW